MALVVALDQAQQSPSRGAEGRASVRPERGHPSFTYVKVSVAVESPGDADGWYLRHTRDRERRVLLDDQASRQGPGRFRRRQGLRPACRSAATRCQRPRTPRRRGGRCRSCQGAAGSTSFGLWARCQRPAPRLGTAPRRLGARAILARCKFGGSYCSYASGRSDLHGPGTPGRGGQERAGPEMRWTG